MIVRPLLGKTGRAVANQYIIERLDSLWFQSYDSLIAIKYHGTNKVILSADKWDYSQTTKKYLCQFLGIDNNTLTKNVADGTYKLVNLDSV